METSTSSFPITSVTSLRLLPGVEPPPNVFPFDAGVGASNPTPATPDTPRPSSTPLPPSSIRLLDAPSLCLSSPAESTLPRAPTPSGLSSATPPPSSTAAPPRPPAPTTTTAAAANRLSSLCLSMREGDVATEPASDGDADALAENGTGAIAGGLGDNLGDAFAAAVAPAPLPAATPAGPAIALTKADARVDALADADAVACAAADAGDNNAGDTANSTPPTPPQAPPLLLLTTEAPFTLVIAAVALVVAADNADVTDAADAAGVARAVSVEACAYRSPKSSSAARSVTLIVDPVVS